MKAITSNIKKAFVDLRFDPSLVSQLKKAKLDKELLYNHLAQGRITLEEYLQAIN